MPGASARPCPSSRLSPARAISRASGRAQAWPSVASLEDTNVGRAFHCHHRTRFRQLPFPARPRHDHRPWPGLADADHAVARAPRILRDAYGVSACRHRARCASRQSARRSLPDDGLLVVGLSSERATVAGLGVKRQSPDPPYQRPGSEDLTSRGSPCSWWRRVRRPRPVASSYRCKFAGGSGSRG